MVEKKLPIDQLQTSEIIQTEITIDGETFKTDVVEGKNELYSCWFNDNYTPSSPKIPGKYRALKGGCSCVNISDPSGTAGTLGFIAVDNDDDTLVGISNNHVLVSDAFYTNYRNISENQIYSNIYNNVATQPGRSDGGTEQQDQIGLIKKYVPIYPESSEIYNQVDVAAISIDAGLIDSDSWKQIGFTETEVQNTCPYFNPITIKPLNEQSYLPFASTAEIDAFLLDNSNFIVLDGDGEVDWILGKNALFSTGRTTGIKGMVPNNYVLRQLFPAAVRVVYLLQNQYTVALFNNCFTFNAWQVQNNGTDWLPTQCNWPAAPGDSGSAILGYINGQYKIIGMVFSGPADTGIYATGIRIDQVANQLNIREWDGSTISYASQTTETYVVAGGSGDKTIERNGKKYWQAGLGSNTEYPPSP